MYCVVVWQRVIGMVCVLCGGVAACYRYGVCTVRCVECESREFKESCKLHTVRNKLLSERMAQVQKEVSESSPCLSGNFSGTAAPRASVTCVR